MDEVALALQLVDGVGHRFEGRELATKILERGRCDDETSKEFWIEHPKASTEAETNLDALPFGAIEPALEAVEAVLPTDDRTALLMLG